MVAFALNVDFTCAEPSHFFQLSCLRLYDSLCSRTEYDSLPCFVNDKPCKGHGKNKKRMVLCNYLLCGQNNSLTSRSSSEACRERHSKCDESTSECQRCRKLGVKCVRSNQIRFVSAKDIGREQRTIRHSIDAESSTTGSTRIYNFDALTTPERSLMGQSSALANVPEENSPVTMYNHRGFEVRHDGLETAISQQAIARSESKSNSDQLRELHLSGSAYSPSYNLAWFPRNSLPSPSWLRNEREVHILKHYIDVLSTWLDFCDVQRTFGVVVPQLAALHNPLLNAILAVSSKHLSILTGENVLSAGRYYQECLSGLIPLLNDESAVMNDMILVVIVILRLIEEFESPIVQATSPDHMQGIRECVRAQGRIAPQSRLRYTALCVMVRQENYLALMNMSPIGWDLDAFTIPRDPDPSDELSWTMLVVRLCADLVQFSNDERSKQDLERWQNLKTLNEQWNLTKPRSFEPVFTKEADRALDEPFPKSWYLQVWQSVSIQHYHLNCVLLAASDPHVPRFGPGHKEAHRKAENEILTHMRSICGIALVNADSQPCMVTAYMSISICGDRFTDRLEQERMFEILIKVNKKCAWPTLGLQKQLQKSWGWD